MKKMIETTECKKRAYFLSGLLLVCTLFLGLLLSMPLQAAAADCKTLCKAALQETGGVKKLRVQSESASSFAGFSVSERKKVSRIYYACDNKEVYSICIVKAANASDASDVLKYFQAYKSQNTGSSYLRDYTATEQKVFKNAVCGKKGKYAWYIAMSTSKAVNKKGQTAIRKKL